MSLIPIVKIPLNEGRYGREEFPKSQIWIHHTAGGANGANNINDWNTRQPNNRVATAFVISRDGTIIQCFDEKYWANHIGLSHPNNFALQRQSIAIEVCNYGPLTKVGSSYKNAYGGTVNSADVYDYGTEWRGSRYYQRYTDIQLTSLFQLLCALTTKWNISRTAGVRNQIDFGKLDAALSFTNGIWTHVNVRSDKSDMHPQPELLFLLQNLASGSCANYELPVFDELDTSATPRSASGNVSPIGQRPTGNFASSINGEQSAPNSAITFEPSNVPSKPNILALVNQIERNLANAESGQTEADWGQRINTDEDSDWLALKQFILYLCTRYMPQAVFPFVELIPAFKLAGSTGEITIANGQTIPHPLDGTIPPTTEISANSIQNAAENNTQQGATQRTNARQNKRLSVQRKSSSFDKLFGALPQGAFLSQKRLEQNSDLFNDQVAKGSIDLFNVDPFHEAIDEMGVASESGKTILKERLIGYRAYSQLVLTPQAVDGVPSKPGAIGFTGFEIKAGSQADDGLALITMKLVDVQGNKFTDIASPWAFILNARPGSEAGDFWFRYGWSLRVPPADNQSLKTDLVSKAFWNHPGWKIFPEATKRAVMANVRQGIETLTLCQKNTLESIFESEKADPVTGVISINRAFVDENNYTKLSILNPELDSESSTGAMTATLNFRTTASVASQCLIEKAIATAAVVAKATSETDSTLPLAELLMAIEYDNGVNAALEVSDATLAQKRLQQVQGRVQGYRSGNIAGLVRVIGAYAGGNQGGGIDPYSVFLKIPSPQYKKLIKAVYGGEKQGLTLIGWLREVLNSNDCTLLSAASGSGAGINAAYVITTTQDIQSNTTSPLFKTLNERYNPLIGQNSTLDNVDQTRDLQRLIVLGEDNDVFGYRHQGSLAETIQITKSNAPNSMTIEANYAFADLPTLESSNNLSGLSNVTPYSRLRNLYVLYSQMQNAEITAMAHPWIAPGQSVYIKGMGVFDGEYMALEVTHTLENHKFLTKLVVARILPVSDKGRKSGSHQESKQFTTANGGGNFTTPVKQQYDPHYGK